MSTEMQVWFLRHGDTPFDYEHSEYDEFIEMLCNGHETPLVKDHGINFRSLPKQVDFVGYSPALRAKQTAEVLQSKVDVKSMEELEVLHEVRFDRDIIKRHEYRYLAGSREDILERWIEGKNKAETFEVSKTRVREIELFLSKRPENTIILVTHGWFLRLLENYFVLGKPLEEITLEDIREVKPVRRGHFIKATIGRNCHFASKVELLETEKHTKLSYLKELAIT